MSKFVLLLNNNYEPLSFINERRAIKLLLNMKVDVLSSWNGSISYPSGQFKLPATIRLNKLIKKINFDVNFNKKAIILRDKSCCQYCGKAVGKRTLSLDHILPVSRGGKNIYTNVVVCCFTCNNFKGNRTPEECNLKLLKTPIKPKISFVDYYKENVNGVWHTDWDTYLY